MKMGSTGLELDEDVDSCCVEDVLVLELVVRDPTDELVEFCCVEDVLVLEPELVVFDPAGELILPSNSVSMAIEKSAATMTMAAKVNRFLVRSSMTCLSLPSFLKVLQKSKKSLASYHHARSSLSR